MAHLRFSPELFVACRTRPVAIFVSVIAILPLLFFALGDHTRINHSTVFQTRDIFTLNSNLHPPWKLDSQTLEELHDWIGGLEATERKVFSQNGEDGVIEAIFDRFGEESRYYVEFGTEDGTETNTRLLRETKNWTGLLLDGSNFNPAINLHKEFITASSICQLFRKYFVPWELDLLSVDIDMKTLDVLESILRCGFSPRVIITEYNSALGKFTSARVPVSLPEHATWTGTSYFGASILAISKVLRRHDYHLLYADKKGVNLFHVRSDLIGGVDIALSAWVKTKWVAPGFGLPADPASGFLGGHLTDKDNKPYVRE
jgi:hypothetical protein